MSSNSSHCVCPYLPCPIRGNCKMCVSVSIKVSEFPNCLENLVLSRGGHMPLKRPEHTIICENYEAMSKKSAELVAEVVQENPDALLCLPAGHTAIRTFELLIQMQNENKVDFSSASFVQLDEWLDLPEGTENCASFLNKHFFEQLQVGPSRITFFDANAQDLEAECKRIDNLIASFGGIDCLLLGIGLNGHVGLNEPGENFDSYTKVVNLDVTTTVVGKKYFKEDVYLKRGITLGMRHVFEAKRIILQAGKREKAEIIAKTYATLPQLSIPATAMFLVKNSYVVLDEDAASLIEGAV